MHALKAIGVRLSIDDFCTGCSSLNYLKQFPINHVEKSDKSFLYKITITISQDDAAIALAIIAMTYSLLPICNRRDRRKRDATGTPAHQSVR